MRNLSNHYDGDTRQIEQPTLDCFFPSASVPAKPTDAEGSQSVGLSSAHISPFFGEDMKKLKMPLFSVTFGGGYVGVSKGNGETFLTENLSGPKKEIKRMSNKSRRMLQLTLAQLSVDIVPLFCTLTYPGKGLLADARKVKRDVDVFGKSIKRKGWSMIWRLEFKKRLSGEFLGVAVPHLHCFIWGCSYAVGLAEIPALWYRVVDSGDTDHLMAGTRIEEIHSWGGVCSYTAKYISKQDEADIPAGCGRFWGIINRSGVPFVPITDTAIAFERSIELIRYARRYTNYRKNNEPVWKFNEAGTKINSTNRRRKFRSSQSTVKIIIRNSDRWLELLVDDSSLQGMPVGDVPENIPGRFLRLFGEKIYESQN